MKFEDMKLNVWYYAKQNATKDLGSFTIFYRVLEINDFVIFDYLRRNDLSKICYYTPRQSTENGPYPLDSQKIKEATYIPEDLLRALPPVEIARYRMGNEA